MKESIPRASRISSGDRSVPKGALRMCDMEIWEIDCADESVLREWLKYKTMETDSSV